MNELRGRRCGYDKSRSVGLLPLAGDSIAHAGGGGAHAVTKRR